MMASDVCFKCGADVLRGSPRCLSCGAAVRSGAKEEPHHSPFRAVGYIAATIALVLIVALAWTWFQGTVNQAQHQTDLQIQQYASSSPR
jgi:hypothetical protein